LHKSTVLVNRLNLFGVELADILRYVTRRTKGQADIIISCVDSRAARKELVGSPLFQGCVYWLDLGTGRTADNSSGQPKNSRNHKTRMSATVAELFPEIVSPLLDAADDLPSAAR